jgi:hypothetical protein
MIGEKLVVGQNFRGVFMNDDRLFIGNYPCGIVYADRHNEEHGDYKRLAFLPYDGMELEFAKDCPEELKERSQLADKRSNCDGMTPRKGQRKVL